LNPFELAQMLELTESNAMRELLGALAELAVGGIEALEIDGAVCAVIAPIPTEAYNRAIGIGMRQPATEETVNRITRLYEERVLPSCIQVSPQAQPRELIHWLKSRGYEVANHWAKFYRPTAESPALTTNLQIEEIGPSRAHDYGSVMARGFGMPDEAGTALSLLAGRPEWRLYVAYDGETPVGAASLFLGGPAADLFGSATLPTHRGQGIQSALMARQIRDAAAHGLEWVITETEPATDSNPSYRNMVRAGFELAYRRPSYLRPAPPPP